MENNFKRGDKVVDNKGNLHTVVSTSDMMVIVEKAREFHFTKVWLRK